MSKRTNKIESAGIGNLEEGFALLQQAIAGGHVHAAFGDPVLQGEHLVITAAEVTNGVGFGFGTGFSEGAGDPGEDLDTPTESGTGGGGGGGGFSRPIAAIIIGPEGARVEPIVDVTKVVLAFFTMLGSIFVMSYKIRKATKA